MALGMTSCPLLESLIVSVVCLGSCCGLLGLILQYRLEFRHAKKQACRASYWVPLPGV